MRIRLGKDITIRWAILTNGSSLELDKEKLYLELLDPRGKATELPFETEGNVLTATIRGKEQDKLGDYALSLWQNKDADDQAVVDNVSAFTLVRYSHQESDSYAGNGLDTSVLLDLGVGNLVAVQGTLRNTIIANLTGYKTVERTAELPSQASTIGYLVGTDLYVWTGEGGDTLNGKYKNCGRFIGPEGPRGPQGNSGYTGDVSELQLVNNLTDGGETSALSAEQGKVLDEKKQDKLSKYREDADSGRIHVAHIDGEYQKDKAVVANPQHVGMYYAERKNGEVIHEDHLYMMEENPETGATCIGMQSLDFNEDNTSISSKLGLSPKEMTLKVRDTECQTEEELTSETFRVTAQSDICRVYMSMDNTTAELDLAAIHGDETSHIAMDGGDTVINATKSLVIGVGAEGEDNTGVYVEENSASLQTADGTAEVIVSNDGNVIISAPTQVEVETESLVLPTSSKVKLGATTIKDEIDGAVASGIAEVVANAPEDLDTLKEIADYIASDKVGAAEINNAIATLNAIIVDLGDVASSSDAENMMRHQDTLEQRTQLFMYKETSGSNAGRTGLCLSIRRANGYGWRQYLYLGNNITFRYLSDSVDSNTGLYILGDTRHTTSLWLNLSVDNLTSDWSDAFLSANQGKVLKGLVDNLGERIYDLGNFSSSADAENKAKEPAISGNNEIVVMRYTVDTLNKSGLIIQQVGDTKTVQYQIWDAKMYTRHIYFTDTNRTTIDSWYSNAWWAIGATNTKYDATARRMSLSNFGGDALNPSADATIPLATTTTDGLMSKGQVEQLNGKQDQLLHYEESETSAGIIVGSGSVGVQEDAVLSGATNDEEEIIANIITTNEELATTSRESAYGIVTTKDAISMRTSKGEISDVVDRIRENSSAIDALEEHVEEREDDGIELLDNGNLKLTLKGETREFMPATPSGDPMHYAYESAEAEYNATTDYILKDAPWKDIVDTIDYKAQWNIDIVDTSLVQADSIVYGGKSYRYAKDTRTSPVDNSPQPRYRVVVQSGDKWVWDDTVVLHLPNHWYLNGLGDITTAEMREIYRLEKKDMSSGVYMLYWRQKKLRTATVRQGSYGVQGAGYSVSENSGLEVVNFDTLAQFNLDVLGSPNIRHIISKTNRLALEYMTKTTPKDTFSTTHLVTCNIRRLKLSISMANSPNLSRATTIQLISTAIPTTAITITLHADAYARLVDDEDIVAALETKNTALEGTGGSVSLVSA